MGRLLLSQLVDVARREGLGTVHADIWHSNLRMQRLCAGLGFSIDSGMGEIVRAQKEIL